ncbi:MAG: hypothetical protein H0X24_01225 [Ktedonobacterales bacterium]|nr:hypothetical protein [Ktedonobacterales bacterium]
MPCNLAISITKACIPDEQVQALFTPPIVTSLLQSLLVAQGYTERAQSFADSELDTYFSIQTLANDLVQCRIGGYFGIDLFVERGQVTVNGTSADQRMAIERWQALVSQLFQRAAGALVATQLQSRLQQLYGSVTTAQVLIDQGDGEAHPVTRFTLHL